jgi:hypothetical protein
VAGTASGSRSAEKRVLSLRGRRDSNWAGGFNFWAPFPEAIFLRALRTVAMFRSSGPPHTAILYLFTVHKCLHVYISGSFVIIFCPALRQSPQQLSIRLFCCIFFYSFTSLLGIFKGSSTDQDRRFSDKELKLLKTLKFPPQFDTKYLSFIFVTLSLSSHATLFFSFVDMRKVNLQVIRPWVTKSRRTPRFGRNGSSRRSLRL